LPCGEPVRLKPKIRDHQPWHRYGIAHQTFPGTLNSATTWLSRHYPSLKLGPNTVTLSSQCYSRHTDVPRYFGRRCRGDAQPANLCTRRAGASTRNERQRVRSSNARRILSPLSFCIIPPPFIRHPAFIRPPSRSRTHRNWARHVPCCDPLAVQFYDILGLMLVTPSCALHAAKDTQRSTLRVTNSFVCNIRECRTASCQNPTRSACHRHGIPQRRCSLVNSGCSSSHQARHQQTH